MMDLWDSVFMNTHVSETTAGSQSNNSHNNNNNNNNQQDDSNYQPSTSMELLEIQNFDIISGDILPSSLDQFVDIGNGGNSGSLVVNGGGLPDEILIDLTDDQDWPPLNENNSASQFD